MSINQSFIHPINQSISQPSNPSINQSTNHSTSPSVHQSVSPSVHQSGSQSPRQSVSQWVDQSVRRSVGQSISQEVSQSMNWFNSQSLTQPVSEWVSQNSVEPCDAKSHPMPPDIQCNTKTVVWWLPDVCASPFCTYVFTYQQQNILYICMVFWICLNLFEIQVRFNWDSFEVWLIIIYI